MKSQCVWIRSTNQNVDMKWLYRAPGMSVTARAVTYPTWCATPTCRTSKLAVRVMSVH